MDLKQVITIREDWPKKGISFKDITPLLSDYDTLTKVINVMVAQYENQGVTKVLCGDTRGSFFATAIALKLGAGVVSAHQANTLPFVGTSVTYDFNGEKTTLEISDNSIRPADRVLIVDDLLATGRTALTMAALIKKTRATLVGYSFVIELTSLEARKKLEPIEVHSLIKYDR